MKLTSLYSLDPDY